MWRLSNASFTYEISFVHSLSLSLVSLLMILLWAHWLFWFLNLSIHIHVYIYILFVGFISSILHLSIYDGTIFSKRVINWMKTESDFQWKWINVCVWDNKMFFGVVIRITHRKHEWICDKISSKRKEGILNPEYKQNGIDFWELSSLKYELCITKRRN